MTTESAAFSEINTETAQGGPLSAWKPIDLQLWG